MKNERSKTRGERRIKIITQAMGGKPDTQSEKEREAPNKKKKHQKKCALCCADHKKGTTIWNFHLLQRNSRVIFHLEWMVFK
jgi:hypothetical protein